ncbi:hypothetical protein CEV34_0046 [Brucella pseudogrignonensis]|uniref:Uncharacterized protein n=1 Tax=Brucella pseudogrignonensis TaxID=419475 RepID=A0A256GVN4_9HYPH|nr:hypothetical protein CEV34_0046 [Brucella pseudogrignonensis]
MSGLGLLERYVCWLRDTPEQAPLTSQMLQALLWRWGNV